MSKEQMLKLATSIVAAEENARLLSEQLAAKIQVEVKPVQAEAPVTKVKTFKSFQIPGTLINERGVGTLKELLIKNDEPHFLVWIFVDDNAIYNNTWSWFHSLSQEVGEIAAFETDGTYVLHLHDVKFGENLIVKVEPTAEAEEHRLSEVFYKLEVAKQVK